MLDPTFLELIRIYVRLIFLIDYQHNKYNRDTII